MSRPPADLLASVRQQLTANRGKYRTSPTPPLTDEQLARVEAVRAALPGVRVDPALEREPVQDPEQAEESA